LESSRDTPFKLAVVKNLWLAVEILMMSVIQTSSITEITDTREICNVFNKYFTSVGRDLVAKLTNNNPSSSPNHVFTAYCEGLKGQ